ncbi:acyltransferase [Candidatus Roizmanbacteria bacterium]|nr:acyltransferase [Candidatus Roizmanbacteria bacterium]
MHKRITYFDGFRGAAALIVVLHHFMMAFLPAIYNNAASDSHLPYSIERFIYSTPLNIFTNGNFAVNLFFILSGFAISIPFFTKHDTSSLTKTSIKRYFRLLPPIVFCNILTFIILYFHFNYNQQAALITKSYWWLAPNWSQVQLNIGNLFQQSFIDVFVKGVEFTKTFNSSLWTIPYFFLGTFIVTGTLALIGTLKNRYLLYGILMVLLPTNYYPFVLGMVLCDLFMREKPLLLKNKALIFFAFIIGIFFSSYPTFPGTDQLKDTMYGFLPRILAPFEYNAYHCLGVILLFYSLISSRIFQKIMEFRVFLFLGKISYSLYIFHIIIILSFSSYVFLQFYPHLGYTASYLLMMVISLPLVFLGSFFIYRFVEHIGMVLAERFYAFFSPANKNH